MKKHSLALYGIPMLVLTGYLLSVSIGGHNKLKSDVLDPEPVCYVQTDIDLKNVEKGALESSISTLEAQIQTLSGKIEQNNTSLKQIEEKITNTQKAIISDDIMAEKKKTIDTLPAQRDKKSTLENLATEVESKKKIAERDKEDYERLFIAVSPKQNAYDIALKQYNDKVELEALKATRDTLPNPSSTQITARKNLETLGTPIINTKKPSAAQVTDRQDLERKDTAQKTALSKVPATTHRNYTTLFNAYNIAYGLYDTALKNYNKNYAQSDFGITMTYAQLNTAITNYNKYDTALRNYNARYANNNTTLAQFNQQTEAYKKANTAYTNALATYNNTYKTANRRTNDNRTVAELLIVRDNAKNALDTVNTPYLSMKKAYDTVSYPAYQAARASYIEQNEQYLALYKDTTLSARDLTEKYDALLAEYKTLVGKNESNKTLLSNYRTEKEKYEATLAILEREKGELDSVVKNQTTQLVGLNQKISHMQNNFCAHNLSCKVGTKIVEGKEIQTVFLENKTGTPVSLEGASVGQDNPNKQKLEISYSGNTLIIKTFIQWKGTKFLCPDIAIPTEKSDESLGNCAEFLGELDSEEKNGIICLGDQSFSIEKDVIVQTPQTNTWSNFLQSNTLNSACSGLEEQIQNKQKQLEEENSYLENTNNSELQEEQDYLDGWKQDLDSEMERLNSEKENWSDMSQEEKSNWYNKRDQYNQDKSDYNSRADVHIIETKSYNSDIAKQTERIKEIENEISELQKSLQECENQDNNQTCSNGATNPPTCEDNTTSGTTGGTGGENCTNGASNPPACDDNLVCTNGSTNYPTCDNNQTCENNATNPPECDNNICTNNATNYPECNNICTNGATNYPDCSQEECGNGVVEGSEECDGGEHCGSDCKNIPYCGNGVTDEGEECDGDEECSQCKWDCPEENNDVGSSFFGGLKWLKSDATSGGKSCPSTCPNGLNKQIWPDCKCPSGYEVRDGACMKKPSIWKRFLRGLYPIIGKDFWGIGGSWNF